MSANLLLVEHVDDGTEGLRRAQSGQHDLLILDIRLPGKSGLDIWREVRRTSNVPILFLTADDQGQQSGTQPAQPSTNG